MKPTDFAVRLTHFLGEYLPAQRNVSTNTIKAYRDAFTLLLRYCRDRHGLPPERIALDRLTVPLVLGFLDHLEEERHCVPRTRNQRLAAIHAFFRCVQTEEPQRLLQCQQVLAIPVQRHARPAIHYLTPCQLGAILTQPDLATPKGRRDAILLSLLYDTGARVQELIDLSVRDIRLDPPAHAHLTGKGRKTRLVPILPATVDLLRDHLREHHLDEPARTHWPLFPNRRGEHLSRSGVRYILAKYAGQAREQQVGLPQRITPHTLRHTKAMHLLQAGNPPTVIQAILGHADIKTSSIYATADLDMKRNALEKASVTTPRNPRPSWQEDKGLMHWLRTL